MINTPNAYDIHEIGKGGVEEGLGTRGHLAGSLAVANPDRVVVASPDRVVVAASPDNVVLVRPDKVMLVSHNKQAIRLHLLPGMFRIFGE